MVSFTNWIYNFFNIKSSKPLWTVDEGLQSVIKDSGEIKQIPIVNPVDVKGFIPILSEQEKRKQLFDSMVVHQNITDSKGRILLSDVPGVIDRRTGMMLQNKLRYEAIAHKFPNPIRWFHIALLHEMECEQNFNCYLGNGQIFWKKTTIVPKGRGPFSSFEKGAIDAIRFDRLNKVQDWSIGNTLYILEGFNGYGYAKYRGINSPYLWSGSNKYVSGKYISDNVYSRTAVSTQIGIALLMKKLFETEI